jgi:hypothetical protein
MAGGHPLQTKFRVAIEKGTLAAADPMERELSYFEWSIVTDPMEIDGGLTPLPQAKKTSRQIQFAP